MKLLGEGGLFTELRERRFAQFLGMYAAVAWGVLEVFDQLIQNEVLPGLVYRVALTLAICGTPGVLIVTWFHGRKGDQHMPRAEKLLIGVVGVFALAASGFVVRAGLMPAEANARTLQLEAWEDPTRVAVLYFGSRGGDDADAIALGLTEGLIDQLAMVDTLHVVTRNGSDLVRDTNMRPDSIARTLGVGTLVNGQVVLAGDQVRVTIAMIEGGTGKQLESTTIDSPRANLFELQDSLSARVALFLRERIGVQVKTLEESSGTEVVEAWELVQRAERTAAGVKELVAAGDLHGVGDQFAAADALLEQAHALDPKWTLPITRRGWYAYRFARAHGLEQVPQDEPTKRALEHADSALALNPRDPDALELRGTVNYWRSLLHLVDDDEHHEVVDKAKADFENAIIGNRRPASAHASLSHLLLANGDFHQAKLAAQQSYQADPFLENANLTLWRLTSTSWDLGQRLDAEKWCFEGLRRFPDDFRFWQCQLRLFGLKDYQPDIPGAWQLYNEFVHRAPPPLRPLAEKQGLMYMAMALVRANLPDSAQAVAVRGRAAADVDPLQETAYLEAIVHIWLAGQYARQGQQAEADEQWKQVEAQLGRTLAANPSLLEGFRNDAVARNTDKWFLEDLVNQEGFRRLLGVR